MKKIPEEIREYLAYNADTGVFVWDVHVGTRIKPGDVAGNVQADGYYRVGFKGKLYYGHRLAWFFVYGQEPTTELDHINGNRADNRISNLRLATRAENTHNTPVRTDSGTGVKGVHKRKGTNSFRAHCRVNGVTHWLGSFKTLEAAAEAVRTFRENEHKEFHNHG